MKSKSFIAVFAPVAISTVAAGLMVLDIYTLNVFPSWLIWEVTLVSAIAVFAVISILCATWVAQWVYWRVSQTREKKAKPAAKVLRYQPPKTTLSKSVEVEYSSAVNE